MQARTFSAIATPGGIEPASSICPASTFVTRPDGPTEPVQICDAQISDMR